MRVKQIYLLSLTRLSLRLFSSACLAAKRCESNSDCRPTQRCRSGVIVQPSWEPATDGTVCGGEDVASITELDMERKICRNKNWIVPKIGDSITRKQAACKSDTGCTIDADCDEGLEPPLVSPLACLDRQFQWTPWVPVIAAVKCGGERQTTIVAIDSTQKSCRIPDQWPMTTSIVGDVHTKAQAACGQPCDDAEYVFDWEGLTSLYQKDCGKETVTLRKNERVCSRDSPYFDQCSCSAAEWETKECAACKLDAAKMIEPADIATRNVIWDHGKSCTTSATTRITTATTTTTTTTTTSTTTTTTSTTSTTNDAGGDVANEHDPHNISNTQ